MIDEAHHLGLTVRTLGFGCRLSSTRACTPFLRYLTLASIFFSGFAKQHHMSACLHKRTCSAEHMLLNSCKNLSIGSAIWFYYYQVLVLNVQNWNFKRSPHCADS